ncbi:hypothetical protein ABK040_012313 [Willaertia magna]
MSTIPLRFGHTLSVLKNENSNTINKLFLFGGSFVSDNNLIFTNELFEIDLQNNNNNTEEEHWNKIKVQNSSIIKERNFHSAVIYENDLIIFGGKSNGYFNDMYSLNLITKDEWKRIDYNENNDLTTSDNIPSPRYGQTMCIYKDNLYLFGGFTNQSQVSNELFQFNLKENTWKKLKLDKYVK